MSNNEERILEIQKRGFFGRLAGYGKMTGPGWLQSAVTLGGGSLAGAMYLGIIAGYSLMWLQPLAMLCGVVMLMALSHVTLEKGEYPFETVKKSITPVLAWGWLVATVIADVVFCTAQASLGVATLQQNLGLGGVNPFVLTTVLSLIAFGSAVLYAMGLKSVNKLETLLKLMVAMVMICFAAAAGFLLFSGKVDIGAILIGFIPNVTSLFKPAASLEPLIQATGPASEFWQTYVADAQRSRIIAAFGSAVGINMTFLLPYTLLNRGWGKKQRQLSRYDLVIALLLPFSVATALLVISAAAAFHANDADVLQADGKPVPSLAGGYYKILDARLASMGEVPVDPGQARAMADALPESDRKLAAALTNRDAKQLANTLSPIMGAKTANLIFGFGIFAMALSTMMVHCLMNGFAVSQAMGAPGKVKPFVIGAAMPAALAIFAPLAWTGDAKTALLIPAAVIATVFLPIAYLAILLLMNSKAALSDGSRANLPVNIAMIFAAGVASFASIWLLSHKGTPGMIGIIGFIIFALIGVGGFVRNQRSHK